MVNIQKFARGRVTRQRDLNFDVAASRCLVFGSLNMDLQADFDNRSPNAALELSTRGTSRLGNA